MNFPKVGLAFAAIDVLLALFASSWQEPPNPRSSVPTYGQYAVTIRWPAKCDADEDLAVRDPVGHIVWFHAKEVGGMHLESDTIPHTTGYGKGNPNFERVVIRVVSPGEYVAGVHTYDTYDCPSAAVTAQLWRLTGDDSLVYQRRVTMRGWSDERTVFRFSLRRDGSVYGINLLPRRLIG